MSIPSRSRLIRTALLSIVAIATPCVAQIARYPTVTGAYDSGFTFPQSTQAPGQKDASAVTLISKYLSTVHAPFDQSFCSTGQLTVGATNANNRSLPATLTLALRANEERLDFIGPSGPTSVRFHERAGGVVDAAGNVTQFPAETSASGLMITPQKLQMGLLNGLGSLADDGIVTVRGTMYHQITYARPLGSRSSTSRLTPLTVTTLLFDPSTTLLVKSIDTVYLTQASRTKHLRVTSYSDYRMVSGGEYPMDITETRDGKLVWTLLLNPQGNTCNPPESFFDLNGAGR